jgi:hypothetical protein
MEHEIDQLSFREQMALLEAYVQAVEIIGICVMILLVVAACTSAQSSEGRTDQS